MNKAVVYMYVARLPPEGDLPASKSFAQNVLSFYPYQKPSSSPDLFSHFLCCRSVLFRLCFLCRWSQCFARLRHFLARSCLFLDCMRHLRVLLLLLLYFPLFLGILSSPTSYLRSFPSTVVKGFQFLMFVLFTCFSPSFLMSVSKKTVLWSVLMNLFSSVLQHLALTVSDVE